MTLQHVAKWAVTGRTWNASTRKHDILVTVEFERRIDATAFMNINQDYIAGMVMDRNAAAIETDTLSAMQFVEGATK